MCRIGLAFFDIRCAQEPARSHVITELLEAHTFDSPPQDAGVSKTTVSVTGIWGHWGVLWPPVHYSWKPNMTP